jgi:cyclophilin family peptidyl-prolyl cis-trans isomerase
MSDFNSTAFRSGAIVVAGALLAGLIGLSLRDSDGQSAAPETVPVAESTVPEVAPVDDTTTSAAPTTTVAGPLPCPATDGTPARQASFTSEPPMCLVPGATYTAVVNTSEGTIIIGLDSAGAPQTVNSFVYLARYKFYDGLTFHRVVPDYLLQSGSPDSSDEGGPGYTINAEAGSTTLTVGDVAFTQTGVGTNGSQFFVVTGDLGGGVQLPSSSFSQLGRVRNGLDVVKKIDALGVDPVNDVPQPPSRVVTIESIEIREEAPAAAAGTDTTALNATTETTAAAA